MICLFKGRAEEIAGKRNFAPGTISRRKAVRGSGSALRLVLGFNERLSECHWRGDPGDGRLGVTGAGNDEGAKVEHAAKNLLIDLNALDLVYVYFDGSSANEAVLDDHSLSSDCKLGSLVPNVGQNPKDQTQAEGWEQHKSEDKQVPERPQADVPQVNDFLVFDQCPFNITRHASSFVCFDRETQASVSLFQAYERQHAVKAAWSEPKHFNRQNT